LISNEHTTAGRVLVLGCHRVIGDEPLKAGLDVSPKWLRELVKLPYKFRTVRESLAPSSEDALAISFDDGDPSLGTNALPLLTSLGVRASAFVMAKPGESAPAFWRDLLAAGWEIGSHSLTHSALDLIDARLSRTEICESKLRLEDLLQIPIRGFAFPYGRFGRREIDFVCEAGYEYAVTTLPWIPPRWRSLGVRMVARKICEERTPMWKIRALTDSRSLRIAAWLHDESIYRLNALRLVAASPLRTLPPA
jgi:peptidoglycan/xylan/chitin deacetylase (PgdA/CDA1 family)